MAEEAKSSAVSDGKADEKTGLSVDVLLSGILLTVGLFFLLIAAVVTMFSVKSNPMDIVAMAAVAVASFVGVIAVH